MKMKQEVNTAQINQTTRKEDVPHLVTEIKQELDNEATQSEDNNVPYLVTRIKQEPDNETKYNIQTQLPFLAEKIKQELFFKKFKEIHGREDFNILDSKIESFDEMMVKEEKQQESHICGENKRWNVGNDVCIWTQGCSSVDINQIGKDSFYNDQPLDPVRNEAFCDRLKEHIRGTVKEIGDVHLEAKVKPGTGIPYWTSNKMRETVQVFDCQTMTTDLKMTQNDVSLAVRNEDDRNLSEDELDVCEKRGSELCCSQHFHIQDDVVGKPYSCDSSVMAIAQSSSLKTHKNEEIGKRPFKCDVCGKGFTKSFDITRHKRIHTGEKPYKCDVCGVGFSRSGILTNHIRTHTGEKPYKCHVCGIGFSQPGHLKAHTRIHTGEKPYKCDVCGIGFSRSGTLAGHKRIHTGEKPYKCDICGVGFSCSGAVKSHKRIHTGEKPYKCDVCGFESSRRGTLNSHKRIHTGEKPYKCDVCAVGFSDNQNLTRHKRIHTGENPYKCDVSGVELHSVDTEF